jgi:hypothetical protein
MIIAGAVCGVIATRVLLKPTDKATLHLLGKKLLLKTESVDK